MKSFFLLFALIISQVCSAQDKVETVAHLLSKHEFKKVYRMFTPSLKKDVSCKKLKNAWMQTESSFGKFQNYSDPSLNNYDERYVEEAFIHFEKATFKLKLTQEDDKLTGLLISPLSYNLPDYGKEIPVGVTRYTVTTDTFKMEGELVTPAGCDSCPLVILVHGSGPHDMDETIGPNKVFKDLALGLAAQGVATFRYEKRNKTYPDFFRGQFDLYNETIDDAVSAIRLMQADTQFHFSKIVALGHSLGAYAMPLIAEKVSELDGAILFSANARPIQDLMVYQVKYLAGLDGDTSRAEKRVIKSARERAALITKGDYSSDAPAQDLMGYWPAKFWNGVSAYDPVEKVKTLETQIFIMQGEMDYQITMVDFEIWQSNLPSATYTNVKMKSYKGLTHLFTPTKSSKATPTDYFIPNNVDEQVILDISEWVKKLN